MIDHVWTVLCSRAVVDHMSNNVSIQNVIEQIVIKESPTPNGRLNYSMDIVSFWVRSDPGAPASGRIRLSYNTPSGENIGSFGGEIDLTAVERARNIFHFESLPAREPGRHYFFMEIQIGDNDEWQKVAAIPLMILFEPSDNEQEEDNIKEEEIEQVVNN